MGGHYASNLLKAGFELTVFDCACEPVERAIQLGAKKAPSPNEVAKTSDMILLALPGPREVEDVVLGENGVLSGAKKGSIIVDLSTVTPDIPKKIAEAAREKGVFNVDAPVSGGVAGARAGTLTIMVGGESGIVEKCRGVLQHLGQKIHHVGDLGSGCIVKLIINAMGGVNLAAAAEAMTLGVKAGVDAGTMYDVVKTSFGNSRIFEVKFPNHIFKRNFKPGFTVNLLCKDLLLAKQLSDELGVPLLLTTLTEQLFQAARTFGLGEEDISAVIKLLEQLTKIEVRTDV